MSEISVTPAQLKQWAQVLRHVAKADVSVCQESTKDLVAFVGSRPQDDFENSSRGHLPPDVLGPAVARLVTAMSVVVSRFGLYAAETASAVDKAAGVVEEHDLKVGSQATNRSIPGVGPSDNQRNDNDGSKPAGQDPDAKSGSAGSKPSASPSMDNQRDDDDGSKPAGQDPDAKSGSAGSKNTVR